MKVNERVAEQIRDSRQANSPVICTRWTLNIERPVVQMGKNRVVVQFETRLNTPKALANFSPGLEQSDNPGYRNKNSDEP